MNPEMLGIVLCGGQSLRMGSDKGLLKLEAKTWAQTAIDKFSELQLPVKVSVNRLQQAAYSAIFGDDLLIADDDRIPVKGPLLGLLSAHKHAPNEDLFVLACDMPLMDKRLLKELYQISTARQAEAYVYTDAGRAEPLCGIYRAAGLRGILEKAETGRLAKFSMKYMLEQLQTALIFLNKNQLNAFRNFNAHAELNGLQV